MKILNLKEDFNFYKCSYIYNNHEVYIFNIVYTISIFNEKFIVLFSNLDIEILQM